MQELKTLEWIFLSHMPVKTLTTKVDMMVSLIAQDWNRYHKLLFNQMKELWLLLQQREYEYYICHHRSHTNLPGFCAEGNATVDTHTTSLYVTSSGHVATGSHIT